MILFNKRINNLTTFNIKSLNTSNVVRLIHKSLITFNSIYLWRI